MIAHPRTTGPRKLPYRQGTPEWLSVRREFVTASMMPVLLGVDPWRCEQDLVDELDGTGRDSTLTMRVGLALEDLIASDYAEQTGRKVRRVRGLWQSTRVPWAAASPDATAAGILIELKWSGSRARFASGLPEDVEAQAQWQAFVAEVPTVDVAALTVGDEHARIWTVKADPGMHLHMIAVGADFLRRRREGGPFGQSLDSLKRRYPADDGTEIEADPDTAAAVRALWDLRGRRKQLVEDEAILETAIKTRMGPATALRGDGFSVTWKRAKDSEQTDWRTVAAGLLRQLPETERAALVGLATTVREGARYFRVSWKGDTE